MNTTKIIESVSKTDWADILQTYKSKIYVSSHAFEHLNKAQRKVFKEKDLIDTITNEKPAGVGLQRNRRYAVFFKRDKYYLRIICIVKEHKLEIITFLNTENIPNLKRLEK